MKKLTRKSLDDLAKTLPIVEKEHLTSFVGGGTGSVNDPFTFWEYKDLGQLFTSGWVDLPESTSYLTHDYYTYYGGSDYDDTSNCYEGMSGYSGYSGYNGGYDSNSDTYYSNPPTSTMSWENFSNFSYPVGELDRAIMDLLSTVSNPFTYVQNKVNAQLNGLRTEISPKVDTDYNVSITTSSPIENGHVKNVMTVKYFNKEKNQWETKTSTITIL